MTDMPSPLPPLAVLPMTDPQGVSIVIPVYNKALLTLQCLQSIIARTPAGRYDVIVVDNASSDETPQLLAHVQGLHVIRNEVNRGFVEACNQGGHRAQGEFLLFLNNDTIPLDGWFEPLVETLTHDPTIGAVGAQLLYPDGRLQEAGGIIWNDGSGWNYGRGDDPQRPEYGYRREVDFCSGACLLVRRGLFNQIGGFDARYAPAYYEDADFCFELRRHGYRVVYQPRSRIVHVEGATAGTDITTGFKRFQAINRTTFVKKQAEALAVQYPPDAVHLFRARDRRGGKRILLVDHMVPLYDQDAGSVRMLAMLRILSELDHKVTFVPDNLMPCEPYTGTLQQLGVEVLFGPLSIAPYIDQHLADFEVIILCRATIAIKYVPAIVAHPHRPPLIFDTIDLHYLREQRRAQLEEDAELARQAALTRAQELYLAHASDMVWVVSTYEREVLQRESAALQVGVVPLIHTVRHTVPPFAGRRDLMFIGGFRHLPNEDAVFYFLKEIFPLVQRAIAQVRFLIVGADVPPTIQALASEDIVVVGYVRDVDPVFDRCRVCVAPIRYGAGLKGKVLHSLACGLPVVTTSIGAEGMYLVHREQALIADDPENFAARVVELYLNEPLWTHMSEQGRQHVEAHFGYRAGKAKLDAALQAVTGGKRGVEG